MQGELFGNTHKEYVRIIRRGKSNTRVELPDGSQVLVPTPDLAFWKCRNPESADNSRSRSADNSRSRSASSNRRRQVFLGFPDHPFDRLNFTGKHESVIFDSTTESPF